MENQSPINQTEKNIKINKPIWEIAENSIEDISDAEKSELPKDGAI